MVCLIIWVFTVDVQLTFCCETCEVSTLVWDDHAFYLQYFNFRVLKVSL